MVESADRDVQVPAHGTEAVRWGRASKRRDLIEFGQVCSPRIVLTTSFYKANNP